MRGALRPLSRPAALVLVATALTVSVTACGSTRPSVRLPDTAAGRQARWLVTAVRHLPIADTAIAAHFDRAYLASLPAPAAATLNAGFAAVQRLSLDAITTSTPKTIVFAVTVNGSEKQRVTIAVDGRGLISRLHLGPAGRRPPAPPPTPTTSLPLPSTTPSARVRQIPIGVGSPPLSGTLTLPAGNGPFAAVVLVSGSGPNDQDETVGPNKPFRDIALDLAARGIATVRYDKRTRDYPRRINPITATATQEYVPDALAGIHLLQHLPAIDTRRIFVLGHSQGGTYAPLITKRAPSVAGVILLAAGAEPLGAALLRQLRYEATFPGTIGAKAKAQLPYLRRQIAEIDNPGKLARERPGTVLFNSIHPAYYLSMLRYDEIATARSIPQPLLLLQGDRDYQVTVKDDLNVWLKGLRRRKGVTVVRFPKADHLFLDGTGRPNPLENYRPGHLDPKLIATIAAWIDKVKAAPAHP
jgi:pimeloyl-ACP methyl ester carboxylesterase